MGQKPSFSSPEQMAERLHYLEESSRWHAYALDLAVSMARLHGGGSGTWSPDTLLAEIDRHLRGLLDLEMSAYFLVEEGEASFHLRHCHPPTAAAAAERRVDRLIDSGKFAWALQQNQAVSERDDEGRPLLLHVLSTPRAVWGMFLGIPREERALESSRLNLVSILLQNGAHALENTLLHQRLLETNRELEARVQQGLARITEQNLQITAQNQELTRQVETLRRTESALVEAKAEAEAASLAKSRFLATMSHEIRTPMNAIIGMAQLLADSPLNEQQTRYVRVFQQAGENLLTLINDILDLTKIESGRLEMERMAYDPGEVVREAVRFFHTAAMDKGLGLEAVVEGTTPHRQMGDPYRLRQVLINLVGNAVKFTREGKVVVQVTRVGENLRFRVVDTGIGIPAHQHASIFHEFTQADSSTTRRFGGSGLGLTICQRLVHSMGGQIGLTSVEGKGSIFHFTLPVIHPPEAAAPREGEPDGRAPLSTPVVMPSPAVPVIPPIPPFSPPMAGDAVPSLRILLAEDSDDNALLVQLFLKKENHHVVLVKDGAEAVEQFKAEPFDLVLMDMQMPIMDGFEATRTLRTLEKNNSLAATPILALTAYAFREDRQKCLDAGCDEYLAKPIKKQELLEAIRLFGPRRK